MPNYEGRCFHLGWTTKHGESWHEPSTLSLKIKGDGDATFMTQFIGTPKGTTDLDSDQVGMTFSTVSGRNPNYTLTGRELYVRALITSSKPPENPSLKDQKKQAWTQPVVPDAERRVTKSE